MKTYSTLAALLASSCLSQASVIFQDTFSDQNLGTSNDPYSTGFDSSFDNANHSILETAGGELSFSANNTNGWQGHYSLDSKSTFNVSANAGFVTTWDISSLAVPMGWSDAGGIALSVQQGSGRMINGILGDNGSTPGSENAKAGIYVFFNDNSTGGASSDPGTIWIREVVNPTGTNATYTDHKLAFGSQQIDAAFTGAGTVALEVLSNNT